MIMGEAKENPISVVENDPTKAVTARDVFDKFYDALAEEVSAHVPDLSTEKGRKSVASLAFRVTKAKTSIDKAGKELNEDLRRQIGVVDAERRYVREKLDALADTARKPLTDWEDEQKRREDHAKSILDTIRSLGTVGIDDTSDTANDRLSELASIKIDESELGDYFFIAKKAVDAAVSNVTMHRDRLKKDEEIRVEYDRMKAAAEEAERAERARKEAEEAELARAKAEAARKADEERRIAEAARAAELKAIRDAEEKAAKDRAEVERAHRAEMDRLAKEAEAKESAARAEAERLLREKASAEAAIAKKAAEDAARAADIKHRGNIMRAAKEAIMTVSGIDEPAAKKIVKSIVDGMIPSISIKF